MAAVVTKQAVTLGDLVGRIERLDVRCSRCARAGRVKLAKLIVEHGAELGLPDLAVRLAGDCPNAGATDPTRRCWVHYPQLVDLPTKQPAAK
jgi:hypothetical protein